MLMKMIVPGIFTKSAIKILVSLKTSKEFSVDLKNYTRQIAFRHCNLYVDASYLLLKRKPESRH